MTAIFPYQPIAPIPDTGSIRTMTPQEIDEVRLVEGARSELPQVPIETFHLLHFGIYSRLILLHGTLKAPVLITGVLVRKGTTLHMHGDVEVWLGDHSRRYSGFNMLPAMPGRKQMFVAFSDVHLSMSFRTDAKTREEAEREFTDEYELLASNRDDLNYVVNTGE